MRRIIPGRVCSPVILTLLVFLVLPSCEDNPSDADDTAAKPRISIHSGDSQSERVGAWLEAPLVVRVADILGNPRAGREVIFSTQSDGTVTPPADTTGTAGLASCLFKLGTAAGMQYVKASIAEGEVIFALEAEAIECSEEDPSRIEHWPKDHIFITTTSSSLLESGSSVLIDFDPQSLVPEKVMEFSDSVVDLTFSARGELFLAAKNKIFKVDTFHLVSEFFQPPAEWNVEIEPNAGGIISGLSLQYGPFFLICPANMHALYPPGSFVGVNWENLAAHPITRDLFIITGLSPPNYRLWRIPWDGQSTASDPILHAEIHAGAAAPRGMCIDSTGTIFITIDGNGSDRRIASVSPSGYVDDDFFDFCQYYGTTTNLAGRWGDIALLGDELYLIDRYNDRLVIITTAGDMVWEVQSTAFSEQFKDSERYGIAANTF